MTHERGTWTWGDITTAMCVHCRSWGASTAPRDRRHELPPAHQNITHGEDTPRLCCLWLCPFARARRGAREGGRALMARERESARMLRTRHTLPTALCTARRKGHSSGDPPRTSTPRWHRGCEMDRRIAHARAHLGGISEGSRISHISPARIWEGPCGRLASHARTTAPVCALEPSRHTAYAAARRVTASCVAARRSRVGRTLASWAKPSRRWARCSGSRSRRSSAATCRQA